jgi:hypothetical protein
MQESQLDDKGYYKNGHGNVLWFSCKQMRPNNVLINTKKSLASGMFTLH